MLRATGNVATLIQSAWRSAPSPAPPPPPDPTLTPDPPHSPLIDAVQDITIWVTARLWLAGVAAALLVACVVCRIWVRRWRHQRLADHAHQVTILPPPEVDPHGITAWWANVAELLAPSRRRRLLYGTPHIAIEYRWTGRALTVTLWIPGTVATGPVMAAVRAAWPGASCTVTDAHAPVPVRAVAEGGQLSPALPPWYPLETDHDTDPMRALASAGSGLHNNEHACVQILTRPATPRQAARLRRGAAALRTGRPPGGLLDPATWLRDALNLALEFLTPAHSTTRHPNAHPRPAGVDRLRDRDLRPALDKTAGTQWETAIRYAVAHTNPRNLDPANLKPRLITLANGLSAAYGAYTGRNRLRRRPLHNPVSVLAQRRFSRGFLLSADELGAIAALPTDLAVPGLDRARAKAVPAPVAVATGGRGTKVLGKAEVGGHAVAVPVVDARQHLHILGSTGSGKSTAMCNLILDDIAARRGVVLIDPKGDLALDVLDRLPASVADRVVLIDPDQTDGARLNPLAGIDGTDTHRDDDLVVDNVVSIFSAIFQRHWGPRIDDVLRVACLTLMRRANADLTLVPPLLQSKQFRADYTVGLNDPEGLLGFWEWYEGTPASLRAQVIGPVLARLRAFLLRDFVRRTVGTPRSSFDMRRVLNGGILIARLPKGQLGEETAKLLGSFVFASVWQAATARARIPEAQRRDCTIYIDEAHNVLNLAGSVADMLAEARGYRLSLVLAHQNLTQLPRDTQLALSANARNKLFFACSPEDAKQLARHTHPELDEHDLTNLDAFTAAARLVINSRETAAFTLRTNPPREPVGEAIAIRRAVADPNTGGRSAISELARRTASAGAPDSDPTGGPGSSGHAPRPRRERS